MIDIEKLIDDAVTGSRNKMLLEVTRKSIWLNIIEPLINEAARLAADSCLVPPDGGSPTEDEQRVANRAAEWIRELNPSLKTHKPGDVWGSNQSWFGVSSEGVTGPWVNQTAAQFAANDDFTNANKMNYRK